MSFNAIVWDAEASPSCGLLPKPKLFVVGRVFLPNLSQVPVSWRIQYRAKVLSRNTKLEDMLWSDMQPLHIFKPRARVILENEGEITLKYSSGRTLQVTVCPVTTVTELKVRLFREGEQCPRRFEFCKKTLSDDERVMDRLSFGSVLNIILTEELSCMSLWGCSIHTDTVGCDCCGGEQSARQLGTGVPSATRPGQNESWKTFHVNNRGLTMYGHCPVATCDSNVHESCADRVVVQAKYGVVKLTPGIHKFPCPLCYTSREKAGAFGMFTPKNFNLMFGRSLFRFKKCGVDEPVKTVLMESLSATGEYTTFDSPTEPCNYEAIEILTVGPNSSPYYCVKCDSRCSGPEASSDCRCCCLLEDRSICEVILSCGHTYHSGCLPKDKSCVACTTKLFQNLSELATEDDCSNTSRGIEDEATGYDVFSDFCPGQGYSNSIVKTAFLKIATYEYQNKYPEFAMAGREEQRVVKEESDNKFGFCNYLFRS